MKKVILMMIIICSMFLIGCSTHVHTIGTGPQTGQVETARQWYVLYGLIPLNTVDIGEMTNGAQNYEIKTQAGVVDILMNFFTVQASISSRTVKVTK